uniref:Uncharacterized protein n=1 Tax=Cannabis sativa TaxID=3483 RepID=A0A803NTP1_CANSA
MANLKAILVVLSVMATLAWMPILECAKKQVVVARKEDIPYIKCRLRRSSRLPPPTSSGRGDFGSTFASNPMDPVVCPRTRRVGILASNFVNPLRLGFRFSAKKEEQEED